MGLSLPVLAQNMNLPVKNAIGQFAGTVYLVGTPLSIKDGLADRRKYL